MSSKYKHLIFDLGGVLLEWDRNSVMAISPAQFLVIMNSTAWHNLDRGKLSVPAACQHFGRMLGLCPEIVERSLDEAQKSLKVNFELVETILQLRATNPDLKFYVLSNISKEHFELVQKLDLPWSLFTRTFASGHEGMRKPDLSIFQHVISEIGGDPSEMLLIDDTVENICAAQSAGIDGIFVHDKLTMSGGALLNLLQDPLPRAEAYMKANAGKHDCVIENHEEIRIRDNFAQLMIGELTGNSDIIYLKRPWGPSPPTNPEVVVPFKEALMDDALTSPNNTAQTPPPSPKTTALELGLWNYFCSTPILTTHTFPPDADTTSIAYLSLPTTDLPSPSTLKHVMDKMASNLDSSGIMQTYFDPERPRTNPEVCVNMLRFFHRFGGAQDPRIVKTKEWVLACLRHKACTYGNRHYSTPESFLYYVARWYAECAAAGDYAQRRDLEIVKAQLVERLGVAVNPLALALRLAACQFVGIHASVYVKDLEEFKALQQADGGWEAGHFCCYGKTGAKVGNRGLTTALGIKILRDM